MQHACRRDHRRDQRRNRTRQRVGSHHDDCGGGASVGAPPLRLLQRYCGGWGLSTITELPSWPCSVFSWNRPWAVITLTSSASGALGISDALGGSSSGSACRTGWSSQG